MRRREYLGGVGGVALGTALAGCLGGDGSTGTFATRVTDQPCDIGDFESCVVRISEIRVKPAGGADDDDGGDEETPTATNGTATNATETEATTDEETADDVGGGDDRVVERHDVDAEADLVELQDGETELVAELELETGDYQFLQLLVSEVEAALEGGGEAEVTTPGNAPLKSTSPSRSAPTPRRCLRRNSPPSSAVPRGTISSPSPPAPRSPMSTGGVVGWPPTSRLPCAEEPTGYPFVIGVCNSLHRCGFQ